VEVIESLDTSTGATRVKTDASNAFLKVMGNRAGPHHLACEWIGSNLARWFGLDTPEVSIITLRRDDVFPLPRGYAAAPGPAFASRFVTGHTWGGDSRELEYLDNPKAITRLVVFDTWILNRDRHPPDLGTRKPNYDNVYLANTERPARWRLMAIDHTHAFTGEDELGPRLAAIKSVKDERSYGLFPEFVPFLDPGEFHWAKAMLADLERESVEALVETIPAEWQVDAVARRALVKLLVNRAKYLVDRIDEGWPLKQEATLS
jgi:hypothetical protein